MTQQMHAADLVELAGIVATEAPVLITGRGPLSRAGLENYWTASKCRLDRWGTTLRKYQREVNTIGQSWAHREWPLLVPVFEEVLTGEMLTRVWTAVLSAYDQLHGEREFEPVGQSILDGHVESRNRVLSLLAECPQPHETLGQQLDQLRRRSQRWTDLLIGHLATTYNVTQLAFDRSHAQDFGESVRTDLPCESRREARSLALASLKASYQGTLCPTSPNADLNARIAAGVIACFPTDVLDPAGLNQSLWLSRVQSTADDAEQMLCDLLHDG